MNKIKKKHLIIILIINLNLFFISACSAQFSGISSIRPLLHKNFEYFDNKNDFKDFYKNKVTLKTDIEEQREMVLTNIYNAQNFLAHLNIDFEIINRSEMLDVAMDMNIDAFSGLYIPKEDKIIIVEYDTDTSIHEIGHAVYYQLLNNHNRDNVSRYFEIEATGLIDNYGQVSAEEFFAVAFTEYIYSEATLMENCPNIYALIKNIDNILN